MMKSVYFFILALSFGCVFSFTIPLVTFDGASGTTFQFKEMEDPVMGSESYGNWTTSNGVGVLDGIVTIVERPAVAIVGASPGFIKAVTDGKFADASSAVSGYLAVAVRSRIPYAGFRVSFASGAAWPFYSCEGGGHIPYSRGCFKSSNFTIPLTDDNHFTTIKLPFSSFSDLWAPATGDHTSVCANDPSTCVTAEILSGIQRIEFWAEGADGNIHIELKSISAEA
jgi:hypothetical protein